jgi:hypothetical protein
MHGNQAWLPKDPEIEGIGNHAWLPYFPKILLPVSSPLNFLANDAASQLTGTLAASSMKASVYCH